MKFVSLEIMGFLLIVSVITLALCVTSTVNEEVETCRVKGGEYILEANGQGVCVDKRYLIDIEG